MKQKNRPYVFVNFAMTWDGKVSTRNFTPTTFSSPVDKRKLLEHRVRADALLLGARTVAKDNMSMGLPARDLQKQRLKKGANAFPLRVVVSNSGRISTALKIFKEDFSPVIIYTTKRMPESTRKKLSQIASVYTMGNEEVNLHKMLNHLRLHYGIKNLLCEGGPSLFRALLTEHLVDEINLTLCPFLFGGEKAPTLTGPAGKFLPKSVPLELKSMKVIGNECFLQYRVPLALR